MTSHDPHAAAIARELEALGEDPPSAEELAMLAAASLDDEPEVAGTARLIDLAQADAAVEPLGELGEQRVWRVVASRRASGRALVSARWVAVGLAIAAALTVLVLVPGRDEPAREQGPSASEVGEVGEQARLALQALDDGLDDTARVEQLRDRYAARLEAQP